MRLASWIRNIRSFVSRMLLAGLAIVGLGYCDGASGQTTAWTQRSPATSPPARRYHAMAYDSARGVTVLFGGMFLGGTQQQVTLGDLWEWNGTNWTQRQSQDPIPAARWGHAMAYNSFRRVTVLYGKAADCRPCYNDVWEWNGTSWIELESHGAFPPLRWGHAMTYDSSHYASVMFGGIHWDGIQSVDLNDTWKWDGVYWKQQSPATNPQERMLHAMAYDSGRGVTVMFGGQGYNGTDFRDTWEWDGTTWVQRSPATTPSARDSHAMAYDSARGQTVLFGGCCRDTWEWDGTTWVQRFTVITPPIRYGHAMAYDSARHVIVLFGGVDSTELNGSELSDTWEYGLDSDGDGVVDACDGCPNDPNKRDPGSCGCGVPDLPNCGQHSAPDVNPVTGACCMGDGACTLVSNSDCIAAGGTYRGDGSDCVTANCRTCGDGMCGAGPAALLPLMLMGSGWRWSRRFTGNRGGRGTRRQ